MNRLFWICLVFAVGAAGLVGCDAGEAEGVDSEAADEQLDERPEEDPDREFVEEAIATVEEAQPTHVDDIDLTDCTSDDDCPDGEECRTDFNICVPDEEAAREEMEKIVAEQDFYTDKVDHAEIFIDKMVSPADYARVEETLDELKTVREVEVVAGDRISIVYDRKLRDYEDITAIIEYLGYDPGTVTVSPRE